MTSRKLLTAILAAALYAAVLVATADAEIHQVRVTLVTGAVMVVQVDVAPGGTATAADISGLPAPVQSVEDLGPVSVPTPAPTAPPVDTPDLPDVPVPGGDGGGGGNGGNTGSGGGGAGGEAPEAPEAPIVGDDQATRGGKKGGRGNLETAVGEVGARARERLRRNPNRPNRPDGKPTLDNPTLSLATPGPARIGVPNFFIDKFRIPPFLLPIYQAAGMEYGVRWEILAAINEIETDYGRNLNVSTAGAVGWMQFMPSTWRAYGVDGNGDKIKDPYNPVDAIFAAARYLRAAGAEQDIRRAVFAYNHAEWYVDSVMMRAQVIGGLPSNLVGSLTGLTQGRFPVDAKASYAGKLEKAKRKVRSGNAALLVESDSNRTGIEIFSKRGAPVVAVNDGRIVRTGRSKRLGRYVVLQDVYGNTYTYGRLGSVAKRYPAPKPRDVSQEDIARELQLPQPDAKPTQAASSTNRPASRAPDRQTVRRATRSGRRTATREPATPTKERLFAHPDRPNAAAAGGDDQSFQLTGRIDGREMTRAYFRRVFGL